VGKLAGEAQRVVDRYGMQNLLPDDPLRVTPGEFREAAGEFSAALQLLPSDYSALREELTVRQLLCEALSGPSVALPPLNRAHTSPAIIPEVHNAIGVYYLESIPKDYDQAIREFREAKKASPGWMYPRHNLALAFIEKGDYTQAEREYREAIATQPLQPYLYYNLGLLLHRMNRRSEAKDAYRRAWDMYGETIGELQRRAADWQSPLPEDAALTRQRVDIFGVNRAEVLNAWGILLATNREIQGARRKYRDALAINANLCAARDNWAQLEQSSAERKDRNAVSKEALDLLDRNLTLPACAGFHPSLLQRARLRRNNGDLQGARQDFARVHDLVPSNTEALTGMAAVDAVDGKFTSAIQLLNQVVTLETTSGVYADVYAQMAEVYRRAKEPAACREFYVKAISATPGAVHSISISELRKRSARCNQSAP
jgi:tetratricopeptide (TPR) repeat protein